MGAIVSPISLLRFEQIPEKCSPYGWTPSRNSLELRPRRREQKGDDANPIHSSNYREEDTDDLWVVYFPGIFLKVGNRLFFCPGSTVGTIRGKGVPLIDDGKKTC